MIITETVTVPTPHGEEERWAYFYLPADYEKHPRKRYPVIYFFDGHNVFFDEDATYGKSWGLGEYLDAHRTPVIVAAVECDHSPEGGRLSEYSPYTFDDAYFGHVDGRGEAFMQWMINAFKPYVDDSLRTLPDRNHTMIAGSSMGGLMTLYAVTAHNDVFSKGAALSPSVGFSNAELLDTIHSARIGRGTILYMDMGEKELGSRGRRTALANVATELLMKNVKLSFRIVPGGEHCEASWERQIPFFMDTLLYPGNRK